MLNTLKQAVCNCIQNVYNLGIPQLINRVYLPTTVMQSQVLQHLAGYIHTIIPILFTKFQQAYTHPNRYFSHLLTPRLYTVSTGPITTKTKEK